MLVVLILVSDHVRVKLYRFLRIGSLLAWSGLWAVLPDLDHIAEGAARQTHLPFLLVMVAVSGIVFYAWCFESFYRRCVAMGDVK